jgi:hypothetical protein
VVRPGWGELSIPPQLRMGGIGEVLMWSVVVGLSIGGFVISVLEDRGPWAVGSWLAMAIFSSTGFALIAGSRYRTLEKLAHSETAESDVFYLFSSGAYSLDPGHEAWLLSPDSALGAGYLTVSADGLQIQPRGYRRPPVRIGKHEVVSIEQVQVWGSQLFRSQILVRLIGGGQVAVTPVRPGFANLLGISVRRVDRIVHDLKTRMGMTDDERKTA